MNSKKSNISLTLQDLELLRKLLNREPNNLEIEIVTTLWAERLSYRNSKKHFLNLPKKGQNIKSIPSNQGIKAIVIDESLALIFKTESHNHPTAINAYQGAATGVANMLRDIYSINATPIAFLHSFRFGFPHSPINQVKISNTVSGAAEFGNTIGVPVLETNILFDDEYIKNPIINIFSIGITNTKAIEKDLTNGNLIVIIGSETGVDSVGGIHITDEYKNAPAIPHQENTLMSLKLMHCMQELFKENITDNSLALGGGGIAQVISELAQRYITGATIYVNKINTRKNIALEPAILLLSETQERIILTLTIEKLGQLDSILKKWEIPYAIIGETTSLQKSIVIKNNDQTLAVLPLEVLTNIPENHINTENKIELKTPNVLKPVKPIDLLSNLPEPNNYVHTALRLIESPNISKKHILSNQFDSNNNLLNLSYNFISDASVIGFKDKKFAIATCIEGNGRYTIENSEIGGAIAVAVAARRIICSGGTPIALTNNINLGNQTEPSIRKQLKGIIHGISNACNELSIAVIGGNVSLNNLDKASEQNILPTPIIGIIGKIENKNHHTTIGFKDKGDMIFMLGPFATDLNASEYMHYTLKIKNTNTPNFNLQTEHLLQQSIYSLIEKNLIRSAHSVGIGGLFTNLVESCTPYNLGFDITTLAEVRKDVFLFGESQNRAVVSVTPDKEDLFVEFMNETQLPFIALGHVTKEELRIDDISYGFIADIKETLNTSFEKHWNGRN